MIFGKLLGALFGFIWFGFLGALIGLYLGHLFDKGLTGGQRQSPTQRTQAQIQDAFFRLTFLMMGVLAKADGRVSEQEIRWAEHVMRQMNLSADMRRRAIEFFDRGKQGNVDLQQELNSFRNHVWRHPTLVQMFLEIQIQAAYADGDINANELAMLNQARAGLGISALRFEMIHARIRAERAFAQGQYRSQQQGGAAPGRSALDKLAQAYQLLGVTPETSDTEIKRAYRRLMSQHHPDKLVAKGLPEAMMKIAKEKTQEIQAAYEMIKAARKTA